MASYKQLTAQLEKLHKEVAAAREKEIEQAIAEIKEKIAEYDITAEELGFSSRAAGLGQRKKPMPARYMDPKTGQTWRAGLARGQEPRPFPDQGITGSSLHAFAGRAGRRRTLPQKLTPGRSPGARERRSCAASYCAVHTRISNSSSRVAMPCIIRPRRRFIPLRAPISWPFVRFAAGAGCHVRPAMPSGSQTRVAAHAAAQAATHAPRGPVA